MSFSRFVCFALSVSLLLSLLCLSVGADDREQIDLEFVGISINNDGLTPTYFATDGIIKKAYGASSDISLVDSKVYFYFNWPRDIDVLDISYACVALSSDSLTLSGSTGHFNYYGYQKTDYNTGTLDVLSSGSYDTASNKNGLRYRADFNRSFSNDSNKYEMLVIELVVSSSSTNILDTSISFSESAIENADILLWPDMPETDVTLTPDQSTVDTFTEIALPDEIRLEVDGSTKLTFDPTASTTAVDLDLEFSDITYQYYNTSAYSASTNGLFKLVGYDDETYVIWNDANNLKNSVSALISGSFKNTSYTETFTMNDYVYDSSHYGWGTSGLNANRPDEGWETIGTVDTSSYSGVAENTDYSGAIYFDDEEGSIASDTETSIMAAGVVQAAYTYDTGVRDAINTQTETIQKEAAATQETIQEETEKQTNAIDGFFQDLMQGIKDFFTSLFIPDEIVTSSFSELLERKLGFIYQVPAMIVSFFTTLFGAFTDGSAGDITVPGWSYNGWTFMNEFVIRRSDYSAIFNVIDPILSVVLSIVVVFAFCKGVQSIYTKILAGANGGSA